MDEEPSMVVMKLPANLRDELKEMRDYNSGSMWNVIARLIREHKQRYDKK